MTTTTAPVQFETHPCACPPATRSSCRYCKGTGEALTIAGGRAHERYTTTLDKRTRVYDVRNLAVGETVERYVRGERIAYQVADVEGAVVVLAARGGLLEVPATPAGAYEVPLYRPVSGDDHAAARRSLARMKGWHRG